MSVQRRVGAVTLAASLAAATLFSSASAHSLPARSAAGSPINIGLIVAQTGVGAATGLYKINGAKFAVNEINAHGGVSGRPLNLEIVDDQTTNAGTVSAFQRLVQAGNITAIIGPIRSTEVQAITPYIERQGIPVMMGGTAPKLTHEGDPWVFRTRPNDTYSAEALSTFVANTLHLKKVAVFHATDAFGAGGDAQLTTALKGYRLTPVTDQGYNNHDADLTTQALAIKKSGADALVSYCTYDEDCVLMARTMHQLGVRVTWAGSPSLTSVTARRLGGSLLYGTYGATDFAVGQNKVNDAFNKAYQAAYHVQADIYSGYVYDAVTILSTVMRKAGTAPSAIRSGILHIRGYTGVEGLYNFDQNGDGLHQYTIVQNLKGFFYKLRILSRCQGHFCSF